jgi:hypothetical protein
MAEIEPIIETVSKVVGFDFKLTIREAELIYSLIYVLPMYGNYQDAPYSAEGRELSARLAEAGIQTKSLGLAITRD